MNSLCLVGLICIPQSRDNLDRTAVLFEKWGKTIGVSSVYHNSVLFNRLDAVSSIWLFYILGFASASPWKNLDIYFLAARMAEFLLNPCMFLL